MGDALRPSIKDFSHVYVKSYMNWASYWNSRPVCESDQLLFHPTLHIIAKL